MRLLVYAFEPFGKSERNISKDVLARLSEREGLIKVVFPVKFDADVFTDEVKTISPAVIIGLGQCSRGKLLRIERRAVNLKKERGHAAQVIIPGGPNALSTSLKLRPAKGSKLSYSAGKYVCNFSMFVLINSARDSHRAFGFIHIPKTYDVSRAVRLIEVELNELGQGH